MSGAGYRVEINAETRETAIFIAIAAVTTTIATALWLSTLLLGVIPLALALIIGGIATTRARRPYRPAILAPMMLFVIAEVYLIVAIYLDR